MGTSGRSYRRSHPWIRFEAELQALTPEDWMLLGEATSKCEHVAGAPLRPETARWMHEVYLAKGAAATTAIEGNTLTEEQVLHQVQGELELPPSREYLKKEVGNILDACNGLLDAIALRKLPPISSELIQDFNRAVLSGLELSPEVRPGVVRTHEVRAGRYLAAPASDCTYLMGRLCEWLEGPDFRLPTGFRAGSVAILKAILAHLYIAWIHPFGDGNGRTARLVELYILIGAGIPSPCAHLLSNHYNLTRGEYYRQLQRASESGGDVVPFVSYALRGFVDQLREQLSLVRAAQMQSAWENYVDLHFRGNASESATRRKRLLLDLTRGEPTPRSAILDLSPEVARMYATKTNKTLSRDLNWLEREGLVESRDGGWIARHENILAGFLPPRA